MLLAVADADAVMMPRCSEPQVVQHNLLNLLSSLEDLHQADLTSVAEGMLLAAADAGAATIPRCSAVASRKYVTAMPARPT